MSDKMTYAEALFEKYKGKKVEIIFDSDWGAQHWADFDVNTKPVMVGEIVGALSNCVDIRVEIESQKGDKYVKTISVNGWAILSVSIYDGNSHVFAFMRQVLGKQ